MHIYILVQVGWHTYEDCLKGMSSTTCAQAASLTIKDDADIVPQFLRIWEGRAAALEAIRVTESAKLIIFNESILIEVFQVTDSFDHVSTTIVLDFHLTTSTLRPIGSPHMFVRIMHFQHRDRTLLASCHSAQHLNIFVVLTLQRLHQFPVSKLVKNMPGQ